MGKVGEINKVVVASSYHEVWEKGLSQRDQMYYRWRKEGRGASE